MDVPTARVFAAWTKESNMSASFRTNARICACQTTDRDLERVSSRRLPRFGLVHARARLMQYDLSDHNAAKHRWYHFPEGVDGRNVVIQTV